MLDTGYVMDVLYLIEATHWRKTTMMGRAIA